MSNSNIQVTVWRNGSQNETTGAGYGIRIPKKDINQFPECGKITIEISDIPLLFNCDKLRGTCPEFRKKEIGAFLIENNINNLNRHNAIKLFLEKISEVYFRLYYR